MRHSGLTGSFPVPALKGYCPSLQAEGRAHRHEEAQLRLTELDAGSGGLRPRLWMRRHGVEHGPRCQEQHSPWASYPEGKCTTGCTRRKQAGPPPVVSPTSCGGTLRTCPAWPRAHGLTRQTWPFPSRQGLTAQSQGHAACLGAPPPVTSPAEVWTELLISLSPCGQLSGQPQTNRRAVA